MEVSGAPDLRSFLAGWPYDEDNRARIVHGIDGREIILVRQPMGLEQFEIDGRPDGLRPHGMESTLEYKLSRLEAAKNASSEHSFRLSAKDCSALFEEGLLYYQRGVHLCQLKAWKYAERDTARNMRLIKFVDQYAEHEEDRSQLDQWRLAITRMNDITRAMTHIELDRFDTALKIASESNIDFTCESGRWESRTELVAAILRRIDKSLATPPVLRLSESPAFLKEGDYWTVIYQHQTAHLKAARGLQYIACLLRHPGREFHVGELLAQCIRAPSGSARLELIAAACRAKRPQDAGPILDAQAKSEYKLRLDDLRRDLEEAERFNDSYRAARARTEMNAIAQQIASAVGLGGRDRKSGSDVERARCAVTKRIRKSIQRIEDVIPSLGRHLYARIKTGYFCSYNPHPERPVAWRL